MEQDDKRFFAEALVGMGEIYDRKISPSAAAIYFDDLMEFPLQDVLQAFTSHRKDPDRGRFFPKVADLMHKLIPNQDQTALVAWSEALPLLRNSRQAISSDPITERVVQDLGGWLQLGQQDAKQLIWTEKEFIKRYAMYVEHGTDTSKLLGNRPGLRLVGRDE